MDSSFSARGSRIQSVRMGRREELALETYEPGAGLRRWEVSADPEDARWLETFDRPEKRNEAGPGAERNSGTATPFALLARARLEGARVLRMHQPAPQIVRLDAESSEGAFGLLLELNREEVVTLIVVTHARDLAQRMARVLELKDARLAATEAQG